MLLVWYPKCSTCQKAKAWLDGRGVGCGTRDIKLEHPGEDELRKWHAKSGLPLKRFFNTSGLKYKELSLKDRLPDLTEDEQYALLAADGMLVKRPILVGEDFVLVGFREKEWAQQLGFSDEDARQECANGLEAEVAAGSERRTSRWAAAAPGRSWTGCGPICACGL